MRATRRWGKQVRRVFARGEGNGHGLSGWGQRHTRMVVRWKKGNQRLDASGRERNAWEMARGKRIWGKRQPLWESHTRTSRHTGVLALPVRHAAYPAGPFLVVVRQGGGREPWDLLTEEPVETQEQAWEVVYASTMRWNSEEHVRFDIAERLLETFRVPDEEAPRTRLLLGILATRLLRSSLTPALAPTRTRLLQH